MTLLSENYFSSHFWTKIFLHVYLLCSPTDLKNSFCVQSPILWRALLLSATKLNRKFLVIKSPKSRSINFQSRAKSLPPSKSGNSFRLKPRTDFTSGEKKKLICRLIQWLIVAPLKLSRMLCQAVSCNNNCPQLELPDFDGGGLFRATLKIIRPGFWRFNHQDFSVQFCRWK